MSRSKRHANQNTEASNRAKGRRDGAPATHNNSRRERNVGHRDAEEHSVKPKGGSGNWNRNR